VRAFFAGVPSAQAEAVEVPAVVVPGTGTDGVSLPSSFDPNTSFNCWLTRMKVVRLDNSFSLLSIEKEK
jgi:hypothetical protein